MSPLLWENGRTPAAYISGANFLSWSFIDLPRKPSYSASFLHWVFLLSYPHSIALYIFNEYLNSRRCHLPFKYPGSAGAGPRHHTTAILQSTLAPTWITSVTLSLPHFSLQFSFFPSHKLFTGMLYLFFFFHRLPYTHCISVAKDKHNSSGGFNSVWDKLCYNEEQLHDVSAFISSSWLMGALLLVQLSQDLGLTRVSTIWNISDCHGQGR